MKIFRTDEIQKWIDRELRRHKLYMFRSHPELHILTVSVAWTTIPGTTLRPTYLFCIRRLITSYSHPVFLFLKKPSKRASGPTKPDTTPDLIPYYSLVES